MSKQINDLLQDSQAQFNAQRNETRALVTKWEKTGLLEGVTEEYNRHNTAILLENQAKQLISEANSIDTGTNRENWNGVALPLVRRIFAEISAKEFVSVQPMNLPSGLVFWLDFKYGTAYKGRQADGDSLYGGSGTSAVNINDGLYGNQDSDMHGRSAGYSLAKQGVLLGGSETSASMLLGALWNSTLSDADFDLASAFYLVSASAGNTFAAGNSGDTNIGAVYTCSSFVPSTKAATFDKLGSYGGGASAATVGVMPNQYKLYYYKNTTSALARGDFEDTTQPELSNNIATTSDLEIPEIDVQLTQAALVAKTRKLKVKWSPEFAQDLNAYHSIDAEAELTSMLSEYISMEIDLEILAMLHNAATFSATFTAAAPAAGESYGDAFAQLGITMQVMSNTIHQSTMRGGANFAVCSPQVATYFESMAGYSANTDGTAGNFAMGVTAIGSLSNRWTVYKNPYWTGQEILTGFRGTQFLETGAVFAPYIPLIMTPLVYDPTNFTPRKGVMTRYAKKVVRNDFYGKITVNDSAWVSTFGSISGSFDS
tara:strand:+ start:352 stop:1977 length:1626 start_codon:yes stop_codon:yes gene_type:complete